MKKTLIIMLLLLHCIFIFGQSSLNNNKITIVIHNNKTLNINNFYVNLNNDLIFKKYIISNVNIISKNKYLINIKHKDNSDTIDFLGFVNTSNSKILWLRNGTVNKIKIINKKVYILTKRGRLRCYTSDGYEFNFFVYLLTKQKIKLVKYCY